MNEPTHEIVLDYERCRRFRKMTRLMALMIDRPSEEKMTRASGLCVCELCGLIYYDHPEENGLTLTCDGRLWKL